MKTDNNNPRRPTKSRNPYYVSILIGLLIASIFIMVEHLIFGVCKAWWSVTLFTIAIAGGYKVGSILEEFDNYLWTDDLTGLKNATFFWKAMQKDTNRVVTLVIIDIDYFKNYNDTKGHLEGNVMLRHMGMILKDEVKDHGLVSRFGGEEFTIILHKMSNKEAEVFISKLNEKIRNYKAYDMNTVSIGYATADLTEVNSHDLFRQADSAMYEAKVHRNSVVNGGEFMCNNWSKE